MATTTSPWLSRRRRVGLSALFLVYLLYVGGAVHQYSHGLGEVAGWLVLVAFAAVYLWISYRGPELPDRSLIGLSGLLIALVIVELPLAHGTAFTMTLYVTTLVIGGFGVRAWPVAAAFSLGALFIPLAIPSWHASLAKDIDLVTPVAVPVVSFAALLMRQIAESNLALAEARAEVARLGAEAERVRIARDLHDLLGHSLTTITVKAGLAHRLRDADPERAYAEIAEVEGLARNSLRDVRAAVAGYRDVTLAGELAAGRELLRAAGVSTESSGWTTSLDTLDPARQELFGWVVREGLTNVVRHARASSCSVRVSRDSVEIVDDGAASPSAGAGNGLTGLRERVAAAGGRLEAGPCSPRGWRLRVSLPERMAS